MRNTLRWNRPRRFALAAVLLAAAPLGAAGLAGGIEAVTKPSGDVTLSFTRPGRVTKVHVKEGQLVGAGELLIQQDDAAEQVQLKQLKSQADSDVQVRASQAKLDQAKVDYEKMQEAGRKNAAAPLEVEHAKLDMIIADLSLELARFMHDQDRLKYEDLKAQIDRMRLESPIAGRVEKIAIQEGESKDAQQPILRIVKIDPLWIDVPVPRKQTAGLAVGGPARVEFPGDAGAAAEGKIVFVADVADAASDTLLVRVELKNPSLRKAGEHVRVSFPPAGPTEPSQAAATTQPKEPK
jgi:RND family efflux transporter MFP subunit